MSRLKVMSWIEPTASQSVLVVRSVTCEDGSKSCDSDLIHTKFSSVCNTLSFYSQVANQLMRLDEVIAAVITSRLPAHTLFLVFLFFYLFHYLFICICLCNSDFILLLLHSADTVLFYQLGLFLNVFDLTLSPVEGYTL